MCSSSRGDILFKNSIAVSHRESFVNDKTGVNTAPDFQKYILYYINTAVASNVYYRQLTISWSSRSRYNLIALSHAIIFSCVVRAAEQYRGNHLCTLCAPIFSQNISRNGHIHFSVTFSYSPHLRISMFCFPAIRGASETFSSFISPFYLYFMVPPYVRYSVSIVVQHPTEHPCISPSPVHVSLHAPSRAFAVAVRKVSACVCRLPLGESFCVCWPRARRHVIFS